MWEDPKPGTLHHNVCLIEQVEHNIVPVLFLVVVVVVIVCSFLFLLLPVYSVYS